MNSFTESQDTNGKLINTSSKSQLEKIKSVYFLQNRLFEILTKNKFLEIIKYNKTLQKKLDLSIKDYKEYSEIFSPIEIELIPIKNDFGSFINLYVEKEKAAYFHIYFNNDKEEIKRYVLNKDDNISKIKLIIDYQILSFNELFSNSNCIESICFKKFYRKNINNMNGMFHMCILLKEINFSNFNTDSVTDMCRM